MNVLMLSAPSPNVAAGVVAKSLLRSLRDRGHRVSLLVNTSENYSDADIKGMNSVPLRTYRRIYNAITCTNRNVMKEYTSKTLNGDYHFQDVIQTATITPSVFIEKKLAFAPDVIIILFGQKFLDVKSLYRLQKRTGAAMYWYMMDSAPLTGGCHYFWDCTGYQDCCNSCPAADSIVLKKQIAKNHYWKKKYIQKANIKFITPTSWQYKRTERSSVNCGRHIEKLLIPIDKEKYYFLKPELAREELGIALHRKVVFVGAFNLDDKRKGISYAIDALNIVSKNMDVVLVIAGNNASTYINSSLCECISMGVVDEDEKLAKIFQASDLFLCPSLEDSGPMMINQSLACGTPVVAFKQGVALDIVLDGFTGFTSELRDVWEMAKSVTQILEMDTDQYEGIVKNCIEVSKQFSDLKCVGATLENILDSHG